MLALEEEEAGWTPEDGDKNELSQQVALKLDQMKDMLADYFSLELEVFDGSLHLTGIPLLLEDYCPWFGGLPIYIVRLATEVEWESEKECFESFVQETARFYSCREVPGRSPRFDVGQHGAGDQGHSWQHVVEHVLYPAIKKTLLPPRECLNDKTIIQVANLPDLYKVFERC